MIWLVDAKPERVTVSRENSADPDTGCIHTCELNNQVVRQPVCSNQPLRSHLATVTSSNDETWPDLPAAGSRGSQVDTRRPEDEVWPVDEQRLPHSRASV